MYTQFAFAGVKPVTVCEKCGRPLRNPISVKVGIGPICRGHMRLDGEDMNKKSSVDLSAWGSKFAYQGYHGCDSHCLLKVQGNVVIATEAPDNEGTSITNMAEDIATQVCRAHDIPLEKLVWIEHYFHESLPDIGETFDLVTFEISDEPHFGDPDGGKHLRHPNWKHLGKEGAEELFGSPLTVQE